MIGKRFAFFVKFTTAKIFYLSLKLYIFYVKGRKISNITDLSTGKTSPERSDTPNSNNTGGLSEDNVSDLDSDSSKGDYKLAVFNPPPITPSSHHHHHNHHHGNHGKGGSNGKKNDPLEVLTQLFPHQSRSLLELVIRENQGDVLPTIEHMLKIQASTAATATTITPNNTPAHMAAAHHYMQRNNPLFSRFYPHLNSSTMDAAMRSAFSPINMMAAAAAANGLPRLPGGGGGADQAMGFPYLGFRPPGGMDYASFAAGNGLLQAMNGDATIPKKKWNNFALYTDLYMLLCIILSLQ